MKIDTRDYVNRDGVIGKEWSVLGFVKLENELIVKNENGAVGLFFLFPVAETGTSWYKFKEKNKARMSR